MGEVKTTQRVAQISGAGSIAGGEYDEVKISGSGKVTGSVAARVIAISGSGKVEGDASAEEYHSSGSSKVTGGFVGKRFVISGSGGVYGDLRAEEVRTSGSFHCEGRMKANTVVAAGSLRCESDVETESFRVDGSVRIRGMLNTNSGEIKVRGIDCYIREIGCERLEVQRGGLVGGLFWRLFRWLFGGRADYLRSETIEGTELRLENTVARVVRGHNVYVGSGCRLDLVEYTGELYVSPEATVGNQRRV